MPVTELPIPGDAFTSPAPALRTHLPRQCRGQFSTVRTTVNGEDDCAGVRSRACRLPPGPGLAGRPAGRSAVCGPGAPDARAAALAAGRGPACLEFFPAMGVGDERRCPHRER